MPTTLGDRLALVRSYAGSVKGVPIAELARVAGLLRQHVWYIEKGQRLDVAAETVAKLAHVLGVSIDYLYRGVGRQPRPRSVASAFRRAYVAKFGSQAYRDWSSRQGQRAKPPPE